VTTANRRVRYSTTITKVGSLVPEFADQGMLIFFGSNAPAELHDMSVLHEPDITVGGLEVGDVVVLDDIEFPISAVGAVANENLVNLGHVDLKFNGETTPPLPGDVCLPALRPPALGPGSTFRVHASSEASSSTPI
jgi:PTS system glucitol/sorbitol-specific IIA component